MQQQPVIPKIWRHPRKETKEERLVRRGGAEDAAEAQEKARGRRGGKEK
jgi:hypothetical protein